MTAKLSAVYFCANQGEPRQKRDKLCDMPHQSSHGCITMTRVRGSRAALKDSCRLATKPTVAGMFDSVYFDFRYRMRPGNAREARWS